MLQDVLYTVCNPIGNVLRIVIFKRNGIQAMVEYPYWKEAHGRISNRELRLGEKSCICMKSIDTLLSHALTQTSN